MRTRRAVALVVLVCILAVVSILVGLMLWLGIAAGLLLGLAVAVVVVGLYLVAIGPWQRRWGATDAEVHRPMPGDGLLGPGAASTTRAITISSGPQDVFPWLLQIGYGRGGWYSYDWIDNDGRPSLDRIDPALQRLVPGDRIEMLPGFGPIVREIVPDHHIVSGGDTDSWCLLVEPTADGKIRLISRWRQRWPRNLGTYLWIAIVDPGAFVMEQKMLRTIRDLAERRAASSPPDERIAGPSGARIQGTTASFSGVNRAASLVVTSSPRSWVNEVQPCTSAMRNVRILADTGKAGRLPDAHLDRPFLWKAIICRGLEAC